MGHFSPRALAAAMSRTVTRRLALPPYRGSGAGLLVRSPVAATPDACRFIVNLHVSRRPSGVPGHSDHDMPMVLVEPSVTYPCYRRIRGSGRPAGLRHCAL